MNTLGLEKEYEVIFKIRYKGKGYQKVRITKFLEMRTYRSFFNEVLRIIKKFETEESVLSVELVSVNKVRKL